MVLGIRDIRRTVKLTRTQTRRNKEGRWKSILQQRRQMPNLSTARYSDDVDSAYRRDPNRRSGVFQQAFLQSTGQLTGETPSARGVVKAIHPVGTTRLALIDWNDPDLPNRVAVANLSRITEKVIKSCRDEV
jgi:hypothetical protein